MAIACMAVLVILSSPASDAIPLRHSVIRTSITESEWENTLELRHIGAHVTLEPDGTLDGISYGFDRETLKVRWLILEELIWVSWKSKPQGSGAYMDQTHVLLSAVGGFWRERFRETHSLQGGSGNGSYYRKRCGFRYGAGDRSVVFYAKGKEVGIETPLGRAWAHDGREAPSFSGELRYLERVSYQYKNGVFSHPLIETTIDLGRDRVEPKKLAEFLAATPLPTKEVEETDPLPRLYGTLSREDILRRLKLDPKRPVSGKVRLRESVRRLYQPQLPFDPDLTPSGILSLDYSHVMIWGKVVDESPLLAKSILVRGAEFGSGSQCFTWKEVLDVGACTEILFVSFIDGRNGWALAGWTQEGPGELSLYFTEDSGQKWTLICDEVPKPTLMSWPTAMQFYDKSTGRISLRNVNDGAVKMIETDNGGKTWSGTYITTTIEAQAGTQSAALLDNSVWRLVRIQGNCQLERRVAPGQEWQFVTAVALEQN